VLEELCYYAGIFTGICEFCPLRAYCAGVVLLGLLFVDFGIDGGVYLFACRMCLIIFVSFCFCSLFERSHEA
jgi:hypothetical protein